MRDSLTHPSDADLLMAADTGHANDHQTPLSTHLRECSVCGERLARLAGLMSEAASLCGSQAHSPAWEESRSRARLAHALSEAGDEWQRSLIVRLRFALSGAPLRATLPLVALLAIVTILLVQAVGLLPSDRLTDDALSTAVLPSPSLTPGAVTSMSAADLCAGLQPARRVPDDVRRQVIRDYRMRGVPESAYELDALITPELGGSTDSRNLWPQRYESPVWNARVKDELERLLPRLVCEGRLELARAQQEIARDWVAAYKTHFRTSVPLKAHVIGPAPDDDDELEIVPAVYNVFASSSPLVRSLYTSAR
jgi:hypothetical protein